MFRRSECKTYILVDTANMFMRARHVVRGEDMYTKIGMSYHIMFNSINKVFRDQQGTHVVIALEGRSWRKVYEPYKRNRKAVIAAKTEREQEEDPVLKHLMNYNSLLLTRLTVIPTW